VTRALLLALLVALPACAGAASDGTSPKPAASLRALDDAAPSLPAPGDEVAPVDSSREVLADAGAPVQNVPPADTRSTTPEPLPFPIAPPDVQPEPQPSPGTRGDAGAAPSDPAPEPSPTTRGDAGAPAPAPLAADGEACPHGGADCESGYCTTELVCAPMPVRPAPLADGAACSADEACESGYCAPRLDVDSFGRIGFCAEAPVYWHACTWRQGACTN
jgi:hypothetical protein